MKAPQWWRDIKPEERGAFAFYVLVILISLSVAVAFYGTVVALWAGDLVCETCLHKENEE